MQIKISNYLDINSVSFLKAQSRDHAISQIVDNLDQIGKLFNKELFFE